ncbi:MBL fold metallo-hydrolase [Sphingobacterium wenxiniae]|uniref:Phosphoribosyl 1,2-cyclic phosphate phosphodiesterase n=1 Tax=Sphingobacterium wenxiniae TaxID=683125 RepID=A0A1I6VTS8_9SPHI|nr:MBL fold metallo-hydrolase [Sphingobacterium wenxiniae]SFT17125.1 phosphoribosyl 1,2-cyclic phosphate phosphodiesterase [Sphingobacterium wenxiniae]
MRITFLGTGTSQGVPVIACPCAVCQSSDSRDKRLRTSILLEFDDQHIVVDTGPDFRYQMLRVGLKRLDAVLITHSHKDHIAGLDDVRAYNYQQKTSIPIYGTRASHEALKREFYYAFSEFKYPGVPRLELEEISPSVPFIIGEREIIPIEVMHYKMPVMGFRIGDFAYITDAKTVSEHSRELLQGVETLVVNALQEEAHLSHFTKKEALEFVQDIAPKRTYFTHVSHRFGKHEDIQSRLPGDVFVAYDGLVIEAN